MEQTPKNNPHDMSSAAFLNSISEEKIGFFPKVEATQSQGAYLKVSAIGSAYSNPLKVAFAASVRDCDISHSLDGEKESPLGLSIFSPLESRVFSFSCFMSRYAFMRCK